MASQQTTGTPASGPAASNQVDQVYQLPLSPISSEEVSGSSVDEGGSDEDSGDHTATDPDTSDHSDHSIVDREEAAEQILTVLNNYPEISSELIEWSREFVDKHPELLTAPSTIVAANPDREKSHAEFKRGVQAICRVLGDERLGTVRDSAVKLEGEWVEAIVKGDEEVRYSDFIDLIYSEATGIVECGRGVYRASGDVELVGEIFGFAPPKEDSGAEAHSVVHSIEVGEGGATEVKDEDVVKIED